ncbi:hypothetical protein PTKIN_Ptkin15bG0128300 [Pterospermum kingtungense]
MGSNPVVFDLSSDDDEATSAWEESKGDDYDWLSEILQAVDKGLEDPDEVVVVGEVNPNKKSKSSVKKVVDEDDDDLVVLDGDPDKPSSDVNDRHEDSDDLLIVGQKGQIACRDFPHPRHDCAIFPFSSTSHASHCELCHCFVCDTRAPCRYWGFGISITDHCHATDKEEIWKTQRKNFRLGRNVPTPVAKPSVTSHSTAVPQINQALHRDIIQLTTQNQASRLTPNRVAGNRVPQNHVPRPSIIRACSSSSRCGIPYTPGVNSQHVLNKSTVQPRSGSQQFLRVHNTAIRRDRGINISKLASQFVSSNTMSKAVDTAVASTMNRTAYAPSGNTSSVYASQYQQNPASVTSSNERNLYPLGWSKLCSNTNLGTYTHQSSLQPRVDGVFTNSAPSQSSAYSQPVPQSNVHQGTNLFQNQNQPATDNGFSDLDFNWVNNLGQSHQQPPLECLQLQSSGSANQEEPLKEVNEGDESYYKDIESFLFDNQSVPEDSLNAGLNPLSPDHNLSYDTGMLFFDIETSWDRLTHA